MTAAFILVPVSESAACPHCGAAMRVITDQWGTLTQTGTRCSSYDHAERIVGKVFIAFLEVPRCNSRPNG